MILTEDMKRVVREQRLAYVATVNADGTPNLSPKATTTVWDDDHLVYADIRSPRTAENLRRNPAVEVNVVDPVARKGYRFKGRGEVLTAGPLHDRIVAFFAERGVNDPLNGVVLITLERALPLISPAYDQGRSEDDVRREFYAYYDRLNRPAPRGALMATLFAAQVAGSTGHSIGMAVGGIMAAAITGTNTWSGVPVAVGALGTALAAWPLARLMARAGRRPGLTTGYALAVVGAALGMAGVLVSSFALLLIGMALFGVANTANLLARYAAADITPPRERGRAMGLIVWGSTIGSILGPNLMGPTVRAGALLGLSPVGSAFLISVAGYSVAAVLVELLLRPDPLDIARRMEQAQAAGRAPEPVRTLREILGETRARIAFGTLMLSQVVMIGTTSTSPVYLHDQGHSVGTIGLAVSMHLGGMYVASPLSGWLCDRFGRVPIIGAGGVGLLLAVAVAGLAPGSEGGLVMAGLFLNGVGWNLAFVAGSALLTDVLSARERTSIQGLADLVMGLMGALGSVTGGMILGAWGFGALNTLGAAVVLAGLAAMWLQRAGPLAVALPLRGEAER
jgi:MFS family permease/predicted pyridoxine 5'-phosphate oxidase superfamily flavin-nucleotide-binding protein